jgi:hypothetical protein
MLEETNRKFNQQSNKTKEIVQILTCTNNGPSVDSFCMMKKALIRSRLEYGIIPYGC